MPQRIPRLDFKLAFGLITFHLMVAVGAAVDHTAVLASSLFTFQNHACANDKLNLRCPFGTTIRVQWARYGRQAPSTQICGSFIMMDKMKDSQTSTKSSFVEDTNCEARTSLEVVLQKCQDRRTCRLVAAAAEFGEDPCPGTSKYLEVAYKCRPNEFRSRITCENDDLLLRCKKSQRIAIYSATFGRSRRGNLECPAARGGFDGVLNSNSTPWNANLIEECESSCSLNVVTRVCQGKRRCTVPATASQFGDPCYPGTKKYLSVIYTCVSKRILKEIKNNDGEAYPNSFCNQERPDPPEPDTGGNEGNKKKKKKDGDVPTVPGEEVPDHILPGRGSPETETPSDGIPPTRRGGRRGTTTTTTTQPTFKVIKGEAERVPEHSTIHYEVVTVPTHVPRGASKPPENQSEQGLPDAETTEPSINPKEGEVAAGKKDYVGFVTDWIYTVTFIEDNLEKFILYVIVGLFFGLIMLLLTIIIRMAQTKRRKKRKAKLNISEPVPNSSAHTEDLELLSDSDRTDGIEILSINHNNRPPPFRTDTGNRSMNSGYYG